MQHEPVIGLQQPPKSGYSEEYFHSLIHAMQYKLEELIEQKDARAVFQLTYLTFSKHVYENLIQHNFTHHAWATDMCCRFVEIYMLQFRRWEEKDPKQCATWRDAFNRIENGKTNVLQSMFLGMNAHINYDLAFCTLGACAAHSDVDTKSHFNGFSLTGTTMQMRYRDYLQINHVGWRSITHIQDEVLNRFNPVLGVFNRLGTKISKPLSIRVLMASRDQAWRRTALLLHAGSTEEVLAIEHLIDNAAIRWAQAILTISTNPILAGRAILRWKSGIDITEQKHFSVLMNALLHDSNTTHLLMAEMAFAGAGSIAVLEKLISQNLLRQADRWMAQICENGTQVQFESMIEYLSSNLETHSDRIIRLHINTKTPRHRRKMLIRSKKQALEYRKKMLESWLEAAVIIKEIQLADALREELRSINFQYKRMKEQSGFPNPFLKAMSEDSNPWISYLAQGIIEKLGGTAQEEPLVESVLFLKDCSLFTAVQTEYLYQLSKHLQLKKFVKGEHIIRKGDIPTGIWFIKSGSANVISQHQQPIANVQQFDVIGEISCFSSIPATAHVVACEDSSAYFILADDLMSALRDVPEIAINVMQILSKRLNDTTQLLIKSTETSE